jgi:hypothetical protein
MQNIITLLQTEPATIYHSQHSRRNVVFLAEYSIFPVHSHTSRPFLLRVLPEKIKT